MCGIFGFIGVGAVDIPSMIEPINHRGPDAEGYLTFNRIDNTVSREADAANYQFSKVAFGFKRLSIIDLATHSNQPFSHETENVHIIFNGEIYNYLELKKELVELGVNFRTDSDTEVFLKSYLKWGTDCFSKFNGMWASCILDGRIDTLVVSRDRFGIKPLYYYISKRGVYFVSEIKQLFAVPGFKKEVNPNVVRDFLESSVLDASTETFFKGVYSFPQSHYAKVPLDHFDTFELVRYWSLEKKQRVKQTFKEAAVELRNLFQDSIRLRFRSDVPIGACLSGGIDSSSIVSTAGYLGEKITAFSVDNKDPKLSEISYVRDVVSMYDSVSSSVTFNETNDLELLDEMFKIQDEPISGLGVIAQWRVMRLAKEGGVTVILDGQGGDEIFGGYRKFLFFYLKELLKSRRAFTFIKELLLFTRDGEFNLLDSEGIRRYLNKTNVSEFLTDRGVVLSRQHNIGLSGASGFKEKTYEDIFYYSYPQLLRYEDRNSMHFNLESRVPFLDYRLVEFVYNLPSSFKLRNGFTKAILRESMKGILPKSVAKRRSKLGFATPEKDWMQSTHYEHFNTYFAEMKNPFLNGTRISEAFSSGSKKLDYKSLLRIYLFDRWYQFHFNHSNLE